MSIRRAISTRRPARSCACCALSITHGPAIRTSGWPSPIAKPPSGTGVTWSLYERAPLRPAGEPRRGGARLAVRRLVLMGRADERREQRMRPRRLGLELRVELHGDVPRMIRQLRDLHELAVGRAARDH